LDENYAVASAKNNEVRRLIKTEAALGFIEKFQRPFDSPYIIEKVINPSLFELKDQKGTSLGLYN
jgi:hypothetical protein